jgi:beta-glucosidase
MLADFLPPFEQAVQAGCRTFMTAYQAIDGVPCCTNQWLMVDILRDAWGFEGMVVTDWDNVGRLESFQTSGSPSRCPARPISTTA